MSKWAPPGFQLIGHHNSAPGPDEEGEWVSNGDTFGDVETATDAARLWLSDHRQGVVEMIDNSHRPARVARSVWAKHHEDHEYPPASGWPWRRRIRSWMDTPPGLTLSSALFAAMAIFVVVTEPTAWIAWIGVLMGGAGFVVGLLRWRHWREHDLP